CLVCSCAVDATKVPAPHKAKQSETIAIFSVSGMNRLQFLPSLQSFSQTAQISKAINSRTMSVGPSRLHRITAYEIETGEPKTLVRIGHARTRNVTEDIGVAAAPCTRTCAAQPVKLKKRFRAVIPRDCKLLSYLLYICWFQSH